ncbi:hypothetical protein MUG91_G15n38 [Manis pentadactyla]|nr:hypothetical protein MUG91_G15n38 [Manis pentadactyla]
MESHSEFKPDYLILGHHKTGLRKCVFLEEQNQEDMRAEACHPRNVRTWSPTVGIFFST